MAKLRPSLLEQAALTLAALLAAVDSAVRGAFDRASSDSDVLEQGRVKTKPAAHAIPVHKESREHCPPNRGRLVMRRWHMSAISREYQARVTGFAPTTEWQFENVEFDGFRALECRLQEAKALYDQFFDKETGLPKDFFELFGVTRLISQARSQSMIISKNPPAKLTWYFMQPISHKFFTRLFADENLPIESLLLP